MGLPSTGIVYLSGVSESLAVVVCGFLEASFRIGHYVLALVFYLTCRIACLASHYGAIHGSSSILQSFCQHLWISCHASMLWRDDVALPYAWRRISCLCRPDGTLWPLTQ